MLSSVRHTPSIHFEKGKPVAYCPQCDLKKVFDDAQLALEYVKKHMFINN
jgi:hypothetical protein